MKPVHIFRISQGFPSVDGFAAGQERSPGRPVLEPGKANVQPGGIGHVRAAPDQDHVRMGSLQMDVLARVLARDPFALPGGQGDLAVERQRKLEGNSRTSDPQPREPARQGVPRGLAANA